MFKKIYILQPSVPHYRIDFFDRLYAVYGSRLSVYHSPISTETYHAFTREWSIGFGKILSIFNIKWQIGVSLIPVEKNTLIVVPSDLHYLSTIFLIVKARWKKAKVVSWGHYLAPKQSAIKYLMRKLFWHICDANIFYTDVEFKSYCKRYKNIKNVYYLNNGLDYDSISANVEKYEPQNRTNSIVFIGRITKKSCFNLLLDALEYLPDPKPLVNVIGNAANDPNSSDLINHKNNTNIVWNGILLRECDIAKIMNKSFIFVYPGSVGLSLMHAMSYGLPSIIHDDQSNHMPEAGPFFENNCGIKFEDNSAISLAKAIEYSMSNQDLLREFSANANYLASEKYNTKNMAINFMKMVDALTVKFFNE